MFADKHNKGSPKCSYFLPSNVDCVVVAADTRCWFWHKNKMKSWNIVTLSSLGVLCSMPQKIRWKSNRSMLHSCVPNLPLSALNFNWWLSFIHTDTHANTCLHTECGAAAARIKVIFDRHCPQHGALRRHVPPPLQSYSKTHCGEIKLYIGKNMWNMWPICNANSRSLWSPGVHHRQQAQPDEHASEC